MAAFARVRAGRSSDGEPTPLDTLTWRICAEETPRVLRHCPGCEDRRVFVSSGRFRVNANGRRLDVWLIHRCGACDATWNAPVHERTPTAALDPDRLQRFFDDDPELAWQCAFAVGRDLHGARVDRRVAVRVESQAGRRPADVRVESRAGPRPADVRIVLVDPVELRWDRLLAHQLGQSRSAVQRLVRQGHVQLASGPRALRRPVRDGERLRLGSQAPRGADGPARIGVDPGESGGTQSAPSSVSSQDGAP